MAAAYFGPTTSYKYSQPTLYLVGSSLVFLAATLVRITKLNIHKNYKMRHTKTFTAASLALLTSAAAQSADPGLGVNSHAQGATEQVTPGGGPNG